MTQPKSKVIFSIILTIFLLLCSLTVRADETPGEILSVDISGTGYAEIIGYVPSESCEVTLLMVEGDGSEIKNNSIMHVDQMTAGKNGTYLFQFKIKDIFSEADYTIVIGSNCEGYTTKRISGTLGLIPTMVYRVSNNSLRVGSDVYDIGCTAYTPDNIGKSLARGNNNVFFKYGDNWYDLLNKNATSNSYLVPTNAIPQSIYDDWIIDNYYTIGGGLLENLGL